MLRYFKLSILIILLFTFFGCIKKDLINPSLKGTYSGTFYYSNSTLGFFPAGLYSAPVTVTFSENKFNCTSGPNSIPAGGSGTFEILDRNIQFKDSNNWTANFDWGLILNGNYSYQIKSDSLIFTKNTIYQYRLKRIN